MLSDFQLLLFASINKLISLSVCKIDFSVE